MLIVGGSVYRAPSPYTLTTSYEKYTGDWGLNPKTKTYWTWSDIDALQAGVESRGIGTWTGEIRVTQLYVEVAGPRFTIDMLGVNLIDLFGYQFVLSYDTNILTATGFTSYSPFTFVVFSVVNDTGGYVGVSISMSPGVTAGVTANSTKLMQIIFFPDSLGESILDLLEPPEAEIKLMDVGGGKIAVDVYDGYFKNGEAVPEFPLGMALELFLVVAIVYVWWKRRHKTNPLKQIYRR